MPNDFKNNIENIRMMSPDYLIFSGGNCPEPYLGQFAMAICNQRSAFSSGFKFDGA